MKVVTGPNLVRGLEPQSGAPIERSQVPTISPRCLVIFRRRVSIRISINACFTFLVKRVLHPSITEIWGLGGGYFHIKPPTRPPRYTSVDDLSLGKYLVKDLQLILPLHIAFAFSVACKMLVA